MRHLSSIFCTVFVTLCFHSAAAASLEALSTSAVWQVRYCVAVGCQAQSTDSRRVLERLSVDNVPAVARQAFVSYSRGFVVLDREIVKRAFARGDFDLFGVDVDRKVIESPEFWIRELEGAKEASNRARAVRALGMCGSSADAGKLEPYLSATNSYLLIELALAFHRLGHDQKYLQAIEAILALPLQEAVYYQTYAIDCLIQSHPERARPAWKRVHEQFVDRYKDFEPGTVYSHIVQELRLP